MSSFLRNLRPRRKPVRGVFDWEGKKRDVSVSSSCVFPTDGSWSSSGGGEPEDGVVGDGEPGSGGEFMVMGQEMLLPGHDPVTVRSGSMLQELDPQDLPSFHRSLSIQCHTSAFSWDLDPGLAK